MTIPKKHFATSGPGERQVERHLFNNYQRSPAFIRPLRR